MFTENDVAERDRELVVCDPNAPPVAGPGVTAIYEADSPPSREIRDLGYLVVAICAGIFIVVQAILVVAIVRGVRARRRAEAEGRIRVAAGLASVHHFSGGAPSTPLPGPRPSAAASSNTAGATITTPVTWLSPRQNQHESTMHSTHQSLLAACAILSISIAPCWPAGNVPQTLSIQRSSVTALRLLMGSASRRRGQKRLAYWTPQKRLGYSSG